MQIYFRLEKDGSFLNVEKIKIQSITGASYADEHVSFWNLNIFKLV